MVLDRFVRNNSAEMDSENLSLPAKMTRINGTLGPATWAFALDRPSPRGTRLGVAPSRVFGIELRQFLLGLFLNPLRPICELRPPVVAHTWGCTPARPCSAARPRGSDRRQRRLHRPESFQRNRPTASERINHQGPCARFATEGFMGGLCKRRHVSRYGGFVELSQLAKSAMKSSNAARSVSSSASSVGLGLMRRLHQCRQAGLAFLGRRCQSFISPSARRGEIMIRRAAASRNACGQFASAGSGHSAAQITARHAANGRRAHQMCNVEMCPCRIDFSRRACVEMRAMGRSTSIRRFT